MKTGTITLAGRTFDLGEIAASDENCDVVDAVLADDLGRPGTIKGIFRILKEAITNGSNAAEAEEAVKLVKLRFSGEDSITSVVQSLCDSLK